MSSINKVILLGNLGRNPEVRFAPNGLKIVILSLATTESWKDKTTGERKEKIEWHKIVIMNERLADVAEKYTKKGSKIYVEGQLQTRKWTDKTGIEHFVTEIVLPQYRGELVLLDTKATRDEAEVIQETHQLKSQKQPSPSNQPIYERMDIDDEIPF